MVLGWWIGELFFTVWYVVLLVIKKFDEGKEFYAFLFLWWTLLVMEILSSGPWEWKTVAIGVGATLIRGIVLDCTRTLWEAFHEIVEL